MDIETITKLLDAGYTKADIDAMQSADGAGGKADEDAGKDDAPKGKEQDNAGAEDAGKVDEKGLADMVKTLSSTVEGLTATVKVLQDANAKDAKTDSVKTGDAIGDAMKSFIEKL